MSPRGAPRPEERRAPEIADGGGAAPPILEVVDLHKSYREGETVHEVLRGVSVRVEPGELVALLGPSGSGKSTLLNLVSGIDTPDAGEVRLEGHSLGALGERGRTLLRRRRVGFVFQFYNLLPTLTVKENLLLPLELTGAVSEAAEARAAGLLERVGLEDRADSFPDRLSGGEQQRVAVVRSLVHRPALVLADEPTGNLDEETGSDVMDLLVELVRRDGGTLLMVTHARPLARRADRVLQIERGTLTELRPSEMA